ncbi:MAG: hypothetical protein EOP52_09550 [Sphingobacteriales bacterium]|nr:MAG: hypothetical protein EOP52_09550 [Sphingobacteriales bacterium]
MKLKLILLAATLAFGTATTALAQRPKRDVQLHQIDRKIDRTLDQRDRKVYKAHRKTNQKLYKTERKADRMDRPNTRH